ncbi:MAG: hypothetical protein BGO30_01025 [Bacteroidetes bacterium 41-46]|jgi:hypothetical protein|nr:MAG: hypothetical protein BGO30_01025 [Bacteroidetes bacterium 41-46]
MKKFSIIINLLLFVAMITANALANALPINGLTTGELSDLYPNLFVPAGVTFSIWGLIYLLLFVFIINQTVAAINKKASAYLLSPLATWAFALTCLFNALWIISWHYRLVFLSVVIMILLLLTLIYLVKRMDKENIDTLWARFSVKLPFSIYLGWISVATIANITALLVHWNWGGLGIPENIWAIIMIVAGTILSILFLLKRSDIFYALVIIWAFYGIIVKREATEPLHLDIIYSAWTSIVIQAGLIIFILTRRR